MALPTLPLPPTGTPFIDPATKSVSIPWANYLLALEGISLEAAPVDARYLVARSNPDLTDEVNLGALATGYIYGTVALGISTVSSKAKIPLSDGGTNANLSATGGTSQVLRQSVAGADVTVSQLASTDISGLAAGVYTPTLTNVANIDASTAYECQYLRVGTTVCVSGKVDVDPTLTTTSTKLGISLPIASNFGAVEDCAGTAAASAIAGQCAAILGDIANDRAQMEFISGDVTNQPMAFVFEYQII